MGRIVDYQSNERMTGETPGVQVSPQIASTPGRNVQMLGGAVSSVADKLMKVQEVAEQTRAQNEHEKALSDIESRFAQEDFSDPAMTPEQVETKKNEYYKQIDDARSKASTQLSIPRSQRQWENEQQHASLVARTSIDNTLLKKYVSRAGADLVMYKSIQQQKFVKTANPKVMENALLNLDTKIDAQIEAGYLKADEGAKEKIETKRQWEVAHATHWAISQPEQFQKMVENGFYEGVDIDTIDKAQQTAERMIKQKQATAKQATELVQRKSYNQFSMQIINGTENLAQIEEAYTTHKLDDKQFMDLSQKWNNTPVSDNSDLGAYMDVIQSMANEEIPPDEVYKRILDYRQAGKITVEEAKHLGNVHYIRDGEIGTVAQNYESLDQILSEKTATQHAVSEKASIYRQLLDQTKEYPMIQQAKMLSDVFRMAIQKGVDFSAKDLPQLMKQRKNEEFVKRHPQVANYPKTGVLKQDRYGNNILFFPDGTYEIKGKATKGSV